MHDPEKSDSGIVVTKPTNKAGRPVAEPAEPRPGTKGNADQQSTHRAQSRARVPQALAAAPSSFNGGPDATACGGSLGTSRRSYCAGCISRFQSKGNG